MTNEEFAKKVAAHAKRAISEGLDGFLVNPNVHKRKDMNVVKQELQNMGFYIENKENCPNSYYIGANENSFSVKQKKN